VYRTISGFMIQKAELTRTTGQCGAVTLIQRFGSALNLNVAALVPSPGVNLTRYHGVFAPNHRLRARIVPAQHGRGAADAAGQGRATPKHVSMSWAQRLKRVFGIEIESCEHCGGAVKIPFVHAEARICTLCRVSRSSGWAMASAS